VAIFPIPLGNIIGGGAHFGGCDWQEFLLIPYRAKNPMEATQTLIDVWKHVGDELKERNLFLGRNLENAWMAAMDEAQTLEYLSQIAEDWDMKLGVDIAASSMWNGRNYEYERSKKVLKPAEHMRFVEEMVEKYKIYYVEDPVYEDGFRQFMTLNKKLGKRSLIVGDDLYCTNPGRLKRGIEKKSTNAVIIKPNQIGTITQAHEVVKLARRNGMVIIPSHRSGETTDNWLADLSITWDAPLIKIGILGVDISKHNRLIELWEEIPKVRMARLPLS